MNARTMANAKGMRTLVIGGTEFIGRATVSALLDVGAEVTLVNRGITPNPFGCSVRHVRCDRRQAEALSSVLEEGWDAVIDFVAFEPTDVAPIISHRHKICRYIVISTDSVYMACDPTRFERGPSGRLLESSDNTFSEEHARDDEYGAEKWRMEALLRRDGQGLDWLALRLPDVLGPHENTGRMDKLLLKLCKGRTIGTALDGVPGGAQSLPLGVVFAADVALAVCAALRPPAAPSIAAGADSTSGGHSRQRSLHICCTEAPTWPQLVEAAVTALRDAGLDVPPPRFHPARDTGFCSVTFGALDGSAALDALGGWAPVALDDRWKESIEWWVGMLRERSERVVAVTAPAQTAGEAQRQPKRPLPDG